MRAWTALRVVAGAGGARRGAGLEAPLVGRDRELQPDHRGRPRRVRRRAVARLVTVVGEAGTGKSRLLWEFFKYLDGIEERSAGGTRAAACPMARGSRTGRLAEMVRARAGILEEEDPASAREKLRATVAGARAR